MKNHRLGRWVPFACGGFAAFFASKNRPPEGAVSIMRGGVRPWGGSRGSRPCGAGLSPRPWREARRRRRETRASAGRTRLDAQIVVPAVHEHDFAGHGGAEIGGEEDGGLAHVLGGHVAVEGSVFFNVIEDQLEVGNAGGGQRFDRTGADRRRGNARRLPERPWRRPSRCSW